MTFYDYGHAIKRTTNENDNIRLLHIALGCTKRVEQSCLLTLFPLIFGTKLNIVHFSICTYNSYKKKKKYK